MANSETISNNSFFSQNLLHKALASIPLPLLQPFLHRTITHLAQNRPELFIRIGQHRHKTFLIDPVNIPFIFLLTPDPENPQLKARRRARNAPHDALIAGTFLTLLDMIDGRLDGDALFFTRDLMIGGDTEAVVVLRNALDDLEGSIVDDLAAQFGFVARAGLATLRRIRR